MKTFAIVVAVDEKMGIGKSGGLPWRLSRDMQRFKDITAPSSISSMRNAVIMGRKTWESLPAKFRPLPGRLNVVITSQIDFPLPEGVHRVSTLEEALEYALERVDVEEVFVIGGAHVFAEAITHEACDRLFLTHIQGDFMCDTFCPGIPHAFQVVYKSPPFDENGIKFCFADYKK